VTVPLDLYDDFAAWADGVLAGAIPAEVVAFGVNLYEGNDTFDVGITGAASFDVDDEEWACNPIYVPDDLFGIPRELVADEWEAALDLVLEWTRRYLRQDTAGAKILRAGRGVGVGFVDGDLHVVWLDG
jgi:shikimate kinase